MTNVNRIHAWHLHGKSIFLSASVPNPARQEKYSRVPDAHIQIDKAVISVSRAVFAAGGTLVFGGHPAISPLVAMVAGEYLPARSIDELIRESPSSTIVTIYQSRAFAASLPPETFAMYRAGYASIRWTDAVEGETSELRGTSATSPCPKSLLRMRTAMISESLPVTMIGIGGMEGVEEEFSLFRELRSHAPVFLLRCTGGAAAHLASVHQEGVRVIDEEVRRSLQSHPPAKDAASHTSKEGEVWGTRDAIPYPLISQTIVEAIANLEA